MSAQIFWKIFPMWIQAFGVTLLMEVPVFVWLGKWFCEREKTPVSMARLALAGAFGSCITHPLLWFVWPLYVKEYITYVITGELLVTFIETFTFYLIARPIRLKHAAIVSVSANGFSVAVGYLLHFLGWM